MNVHISLAGQADGHRIDVNWPTSWPVPRRDDTIALPGMALMRVRSVTWYPLGDGTEPGPFAYVVAGP